MREIDIGRIEETVYALCRSACCEIGEDVLTLLEQGLARERSPFGREILRQLIENDRLACARRMPICQDTGMAVVFMDVGQDVHLSGGGLTQAVDRAVRRAYRDGCFRNSVLDPLTRKNTGDNTPAVLYTRIVPGEQVEIAVAPKGFGSENMSRLGMLTPSQGLEGVLDFVVETVRLPAPIRARPWWWAWASAARPRAACCWPSASCCAMRARPRQIRSLRRSSGNSSSASTAWASARRGWAAT